MVDERVHTGVDEAKHCEQTESCLVHYHNLYRHAPTRKYMSLVRSNGQSFRWGKGGNVTSAGWQVTLCEPTWHVSSVAAWQPCELLYTCYLLTYRRLRPRCCHLRSYFKRPKSSPMRPLASNRYYCAQLIARPKAACALCFSWTATSRYLGL